MDNLVIVNIRVSKEVARFFRKKRYLKSGVIVEKEFENVDILVSYRVCNDMEIIPLIQNWIPHIRVVEPLRVKEKILQNRVQAIYEPKLKTKNFVSLFCII